jgi:hypothetical protein
MFRHACGVPSVTIDGKAWTSRRRDTVHNGLSYQRDALFRGRPLGYAFDVRFGNVSVRPLGGGLGCLTMILVSIVLSVILTIALNLVAR